MANLGIYRKVGDYMIKATITYGDSIFNATEQLKTFENLETAIAWCKRNYQKIHAINGVFTYCEMPSYFDLFDALKRG